MSVEWDQVKSELAVDIDQLRALPRSDQTHWQAHIKIRQLAGRTIGLVIARGYYSKASILDWEVKVVSVSARETTTRRFLSLQEPLEDAPFVGRRPRQENLTAELVLQTFVQWLRTGTVLLGWAKGVPEESEEERLLREAVASYLEPLPV